MPTGKPFFIPCRFSSCCFVSSSGPPPHYHASMMIATCRIVAILLLLLAPSCAGISRGAVSSLVPRGKKRAAAVLQAIKEDDGLLQNLLLEAQGEKDIILALPQGGTEAPTTAANPDESASSCPATASRFYDNSTLRPLLEAVSRCTYASLRYPARISVEIFGSLTHRHTYKYT